MPAPLAFLHTAAAHASTFERLVQRFAPGLAVRHQVDDVLLADAQRLGADDPALVARVHQAMGALAAEGAVIVVCTCSTLGAAAERTPMGAGFAAMRIDRAMAEHAVALGPRVLVVAALDSTLEPTARLVMESAAAAGRDVRLRRLVVPEAWAHFTDGNTARYIGTIVQAVADHARDTDAIVLAQASMAPAVQPLAERGIAALSSPELGVRAALVRLAGR
jgi:hypothetical protein